MLVGLVSGCWAVPAPALPHTAPLAHAPAPVDPFIAARRIEPVQHEQSRGVGAPSIPGRGAIDRNDVILLEGSTNRRIAKASDVAESDFLSQCVREFVLAQPEPTRRPLTVVLTQYFTTCEPNGRIALERPLAFDSRDRRSRSDASFRGTLSQRPDMVLRVAYCSGDSASPDHITIVADGVLWTSQRLEFQRDSNTCDVAELPLTHAFARSLLQVTDATEAVIRFEGHRVSGELAVTETMKRELRIVLEALDALSDPMAGR